MCDWVLKSKKIAPNVGRFSRKSFFSGMASSKTGSTWSNGTAATFRLMRRETAPTALSRALNFAGVASGATLKMGRKAERREVLLEGWQLVRREASPLDSRREKMQLSWRQAVKVLCF